MISLPDIILPKVHYFGLSIDRVSLRGIELNSQGAVRAIAEVTFPDDVFHDGILAKPDEFSLLIRKLVTTGRFSSPYVAVCFPEAFAYSRGFSLPIIPLEEMQEAISWHTKELFPFPPEDIYFDWKIQEKGEKEYNLSVVAVQKKVMDPLVASLIKAGLKPLRFEPGASVIARVLLLKPDQHALVLEINRNVAYVTLVEGDKALFTTLVNYTPQDTPGIYVNNINQTLKEITTYYHQKGILSEDKSEVILTGEIASEEWTKQIIYPAKLLHTPVQNPGFNKAFAAASAAIKPPEDADSINLLPEAMQKFYDTERNTLFYRLILLRVTIYLVILSILSVFVFTGITLEKQRLDNEIKQLQSANDSSKGNTQNLLVLNAQARNVVLLSKLRTTPKDKFAEILALVPEGIKISQMDYDDSKLQFTFTGIANTRDTLLAFKDKLEASGDYDKITLPLGILESPVNVAFTLSFVTK